MSEPAANSQIEDVLSSIRRLVAEEIGQNPFQGRSQPEPEGQKLVLSPTQKIRKEAAETGADLWQETADLSPKQPEAQWWMRSEHDQVIPKAEKSRMVMEDPDVAEEPPAMAQPVEDAEIADNDLPEALRPKPVGRLDGALAELEAALSRQDIDFEPPEGEDEYNGGLEMTSMPWSEEPLNFAEDETDATDEASEDAAVLAAVEEELDPEAEDFDVAASEIDVPAPGETFEGVFSDDVEDPIESNEFEADEAEAAEEADFSYDPHEKLFERSEPAAAIRPQTEEAYSEAEDDFVEDAEPDYDRPRMAQLEIDPADLIDEEALRQLVADIVRQELQGTLGERITRNVRKLVRREIHRALMSFETDQK